MNKSLGLQSGAVKEEDQKVCAFGDRVMQYVAGRGELKGHGATTPAIGDVGWRELPGDLSGAVKGRVRRQNWRGRRGGGRDIVLAGVDGRIQVGYGSEDQSALGRSGRIAGDFCSLSADSERVLKEKMSIRSAVGFPGKSHPLELLRGSLFRPNESMIR